MANRLQQVRQGVLENATLMIQYDECDMCNKFGMATLLKDTSKYPVDLLLCLNCIKMSFNAKQEEYIEDTNDVSSE